MASRFPQYLCYSPCPGCGWFRNDQEVQMYSCSRCAYLRNEYIKAEDAKMRAFEKEREASRG